MQFVGRTIVTLSIILVIITLLSCQLVEASRVLNIGKTSATNNGGISKGSNDGVFRVMDATTSALIRERYGTSDETGGLRNAIPRFGGNKEFDPSNTDYFISVGSLAAIGLVLALLTMISGIVVCMARCCCRCCGASPPPQSGYKDVERRNPFIILVVFSLAALAFTGVGLRYNDSFSNGTTGDSDGILPVIIRVLDQTRSLGDTFFGKLQSLKSQSPGIAADVDTRLNNAADIANGTAALIAHLHQLSIEMNNLNVTVKGVAPTSDQVYECTYCKDKATDISNIATEIQNKADPFFNSIQTTADDVRTQVVDAETQLIDAVDDASKMIIEMKNKTDEPHQQLVDILPDIKTYDGHRRKVVIAFLVFPIIALLLALGGYIIKSPKLFTVNYIVGFIVTTLLFLMLMIHLPLAAISGDACVYLDEQEVDLSNTLGNDTAVIVNACLLNTSLIQALNLTDDLDFANKLNFTTPDFVSSFDFTQFDSFRTNVSQLTIDTFAYNGTTFQQNTDTQISGLNEIVSAYGDYFVEANVSSCNPNNYDNTVVHPQCSCTDRSAVNQLRGSILTSIQARHDLNATLNRVKGNVSAIYAEADDLRARALAFQTELNDIRSLLDPILDIVHSAEDLAYCGFIGDAYGDVKKGFCTTTVTALSYLALAFFLVPLFSIPIIGISVMLIKRVKWPEGTVPDDGTWHGAPDATGNEMVTRKPQPVVVDTPTTQQPVSDQPFHTNPMVMTSRTSTISVPLVPYVAPSDASPQHANSANESAYPHITTIEAEQHHGHQHHEHHDAPPPPPVEFVPLGHGDTNAPY